MVAYNYTQVAPSATWDITGDFEFLGGICRPQPHPMRCSWLGLTFDCMKGYDIDDSTMVSYIIRGSNINFILLFLIAAYNGVLLMNEVSQRKLWTKRGTGKKEDKSGDADGSGDAGAGQKTTTVTSTKTDDSGTFDEFWLFRANQMWYAFITSLFALIRLHYHVGKPLVIGAALHNLSEWYMIVFAFNKTPESRKKYAIISVLGIFTVIAAIIVTSSFEAYVTIEQLAGIVCDYLLPFIWFELLLQQKNHPQLRDAFTFAFLAHFFHLTGTIIPLVIENVLVAESQLMSIMLEGAIFATGPLAHLLYTIFATRYQKLVISTRHFADHMVLNDFKRLVTVAIVFGLITTVVFPLATRPCDDDIIQTPDLSHLQNLPPIDNVNGLNGGMGPIVGRAIGRVKVGFETDFENLIKSEKLVENALNWDGNVFYYFVRDNSGPKKDDVTGEIYTEYQFFESWQSVEKVTQWIQDFAGDVFNKHSTKSMLIDKKLIMPSERGYTLNQFDLYSFSKSE